MSEYNSLPDIWKEHPESVVCVLLHMFTCSPLEVVAGMDDEWFRKSCRSLESIIPSKPAIIVVSWLISIEWRCDLIDQHCIHAENQVLLYLKVRSVPFRIDVLHSIPNVHGIPMCSGLLVCPEPAFLVPTLGHQHIQKCIYKILSIDYY
jgi:hypothetical protein